MIKNLALLSHKCNAKLDVIFINLVLLKRILCFMKLEKYCFIKLEKYFSINSIIAGLINFKSCLQSTKLFANIYIFYITFVLIKY